MQIDEFKNYVRALIEQENTLLFSNWFDPLKVMAFVEIESAFDPRAYRYEQRLNDASYGLMQILYKTAKDMGFGQGPHTLFDAPKNIHFGMVYLHWLWNDLEKRLNRTPTQKEWVMSYNQGPANTVKGEIDEAYYDRWEKALSQWTSGPQKS